MDKARGGAPGTWVRMLALGVTSVGGAGFAPRAPGTVGSLVGIVSGWALMAYAPRTLGIAILAASLLGLLAIRAARIEGDPGHVVIDELAGQWVALLGLTRADWPGLLAAFVLFRFLDIVKPGPVGWADRQKGAAGIMADDLIAGGLAAAVLWAANSRWPGVL